MSSSLNSKTEGEKNWQEKLAGPLPHLHEKLWVDMDLSLLQGEAV